MRIAALALVGAVAVSVALAGCSPDVPPTATPTPKATTVFRSDADALRAAEKAYRAYEAAVDRALTEVDASALSTVAAGPALKAARDSVATLRRSDQHDVGSSTISRVKAADLSGLLSARPSSGQIYACLDVSAVQVLDAAGNHVSSSGGNTVLPMLVTLNLDSRRTLLVHEESVWDGTDFCE